MPLIFFIGSVVGLFTGKKFNAIQAVSEAVETTVPVLGKLMGVGMFIQVMTLTGVRGYIVVSCFGFGLIVLYAAVCLVMPAFGAVSSYGAASVLGVPFLLALLDTGDQIVIAAALSFICSMGRPDAAHGPGGQLCGPDRGTEVLPGAAALRHPLHRLHPVRPGHPAGVRQPFVPDLR